MTLGLLGALKFVLKIKVIEICQHFLLHLQQRLSKGSYELG